MTRVCTATSREQLPDEVVALGTVGELLFLLFLLFLSRPLRNGSSGRGSSGIGAAIDLGLA